MATSTDHQFKLTDPLFLLGIVMFFCNWLTNAYFNVPVLETLLPFITLAFVIRDKTFSRIGRVPGILLTLLFIMWITTSNIYNHITFIGQFRNTIVLTTLLLPVLFFMLMKNREPFMRFIAGVMAGMSLFFVVFASYMFMHGGISRELRGIQPTPVVMLAFFTLFRNRMTKSLQVMIIMLVAISFAVALSIEARGAILSLGIAAAIYMAARLSPWPKITVPALVVLGLMAHYLLSFYIGSSFDAVANSDNNTVSNLERAYAIDLSRMLISQSPWFGSSPQGFAVNFTDYFKYIAGFTEEGDQIASPHNTFLEYAVFFGYPGAFLFLLVVSRIILAGMVSKPYARSLAVAFAAAGIIRLGAFYGFSGTLRMEWFSMMFILLYAYKNQQTETPAITEEVPLKSAVKLTPAQQRAAAAAAARKVSARAS